MCYRFRGQNGTAVEVAKLSAVLIIFCFAECAAGSCLSYGHSCWGAHGKRNDGTLNKLIPLKNDLTANDFPVDTRWFLSRLLRGGSDGGRIIMRAHDLPSANSKDNLRDSVDAEDSKSVEEEMADYQELLPQIEAMMPEFQQALKSTADKIKFLKVWKNNDGKLN